MVKIKQSARKVAPIGITRLPLATFQHGKTERPFGGLKRKYRVKSGTKALREIRKLQKSTNLLIPRIAFQRLVKEICQNFQNNSIRFQSAAIEAIRVAAEDFLTERFEEANLCAVHAKRVTLKPWDLALTCRLNANKV